ncbi:type VI secretion system baseplate subunit TssK, partial [Burkholderia pseudomallei]
PEPLVVPADAKDQLVVLALPLWRGGAQVVSFGAGGNGEGHGGDGKAHAGFARFVVRDYEVAVANEVALGPALLRTGRL